MIRIHYKIQFILFLICLFFIGIGVFETLGKEFKTNKELLWQISHFVPFVLSAVLFGGNLFQEFKNQKTK